MKVWKMFLVVVAVGFFAGCDWNRIFGPPMATVTIGVASRLAGDTLQVYVNDRPLPPPVLTDSVPAFRWRVEIQVVRQTGYQPYDYGEVHVNARSVKFGRLSRTQRQTAYTDRVTAFEFNEWDFRP